QRDLVRRAEPSRDAQDFVERGLAVFDAQEARFAEAADRELLDVFFVEARGGARLDEVAQLVVELEHLEDAGAAGVAGLVAFVAALRAADERALLDGDAV